MALQGTLSDFGIDEVLRLLEHGKKRGRLRVTAPAGSGNVWVDDGTVLASASGADEPAGDHTEVVFQLMRLEEGEFNFHTDDAPSSSSTTESIADVLTASAARLAEWKQLSEVLPSVEHWLALSDEITSTATIEPAQWKVLAHIGGGTKITTCVDELGLGLVPGCRLIVELVERSLLTVSEDQPARAVVQSGRVDPQLPSVGAHQDGDESKDVETDAKSDESTDDEQAGAKTAKSSGSKGSAAKTSATKASTTKAEAAKSAGAKDGAEDAASKDAAEDAKADSSKSDESEADEAKSDPSADGESSDGAAADGDTDADVNPRALLRLLNSVK